MGTLHRADLRTADAATYLERGDSGDDLRCSDDQERRAPRRGRMT